MKLVTQASRPDFELQLEESKSRRTPAIREIGVSIFEVRPESGQRHDRDCQARDPTAFPSARNFSKARDCRYDRPNIDHLSNYTAGLPGSKSRR